jgi:hypothetical protein
MATGGTKVGGRILCYKLTSDILSGFENIDENSLTKDNITDVVSDNIVMTMLRINLEGHLKAFPKAEANEILEETLGVSGTEIAMLNVQIIGKGNTDSFLMMLISTVVDKLKTAKKPVTLSKKRTLHLAKTHTMMTTACETNTARNVSMVLVVVLAALCVYLYTKQKK